MACGCESASNNSNCECNNWVINPVSTDSCKYRVILEGSYDALSDCKGTFELNYLLGREVVCNGAKYCFLGTRTITKCCESYTKNVIVCIEREIVCQNNCDCSNEFTSVFKVLSIKDIC